MTLGLAWQPVERGLADIDGVTRNQIATFSTRRAEITTLTEELGLDSAAARAIAARATRAEKQEPADWGTLEAEWRSQLDTVVARSARPLNSTLRSNVLPNGLESCRINQREAAN